MMSSLSHQPSLLVFFQTFHELPFPLFQFLADHVVISLAHLVSSGGSCSRSRGVTGRVHTPRGSTTKTCLTIANVCPHLGGGGGGGGRRGEREREMERGTERERGREGGREGERERGRGRGEERCKYHYSLF